MNERIKNLIEQSYIEVPHERDWDATTRIFDKEKFAELIIRECANFLDENSGYDDAGNSWHPEPEDLLNYFGVEE